MKTPFMTKALLGVIAGGLLLLGYFLLDGTVIRPIISFDGDLVTTQESYSPGDTVQARVKFCKYRNVPATVQWTLSNGRLTFYSAHERNLGTTGCFDRVTDIEELSPRALPGTYRFNGTLIYRVNPLRNIVVNIQTTPFTIK